MLVITAGARHSGISGFGSVNVVDFSDFRFVENQRQRDIITAGKAFSGVAGRALVVVHEPALNAF